MITAIHTLIYSEDAPATRAFFRDVLGWPYVEMHDGWLIFKTGPSEMGVHPTAGEWEGKPYSSPLHHSVSIMCDDIESTIVELKGKGASFKGEVTNEGWGLTILLVVPGAGDMMLYQPLHPKAYDL
jgi:catechol 2,3-dioxygenase-like lactoylglutathione lyase family enzyme